jgi:hypothetical protein
MYTLHYDSIHLYDLHHDDLIINFITENLVENPFVTGQSGLEVPEDAEAKAMREAQELQVSIYMYI